MLDALGLIHMNGRVYNPVLGRFVSADTYIQAPENSQSFNRYTYVINNPLSLTDPSGNFFGMPFIASAIFSAIASKAFEPLLGMLPGPLAMILSIAIGFALPGASMPSFAEAAFGGFAAAMITTGGDLRQGIIGVLTSVAFYGAGNAIASHITSQFGQWLTRSVAFGVIGGIGAELGGGSFLSGFVAAGAVTALTPIIGGALQAVGDKLKEWDAPRRMSEAMRYDPNRSFAFDYPTFSQETIDAVSGFGDAISFGATRYIRDSYNIGAADYSSDSYIWGRYSGYAYSTVLGGAIGARLAGAAGRGMEFSHWYPARWGGARSLLNGNYVTTIEHALSDPFRYRFMPRAWKALNPLPNAIVQQWNRIPFIWKGIVGGATYGEASNSLIDSMDESR
jgi:RHS repeat-associated protein